VTAYRLVTEPALVESLRERESQLDEQGLVLNASQRFAAKMVGLMVGGALLAFGGMKLSIALDRGKSNVAFLIVLLVIVGILTLVSLSRVRRVSPRGRAELARQRAMAQATLVRGRAPQGEAALPLVAALGLTALPFLPAGAIESMWPRYNQVGSGCGSTSGCGSSCSSGGGDGGGSGCGGCGGGGD
jgi:uncharacterized protein (TIGR04222 family)